MPQQTANILRALFETLVADSFMVLGNHKLTQHLGEKVVPILQEHGLSRTEHEAQ